MLDRTKAPPLKELSQLKLTSPVIHTLDNGIPVYETNMGTQDVLKLELVFDAGRPYEDKHQIARTTASLLKEGTKYHTSSELAEKFDFYGSALSVPVNLDTTNVVLYCLTKYFSKQLPLVAEVLTDPIYPKTELDSFIKNCKQRLQLDLAKNDILAYRKVTEYIFGKNHPYGYNSSIEIFDNIKREDLLKHHEQNYHAGNCKIFISGKTSPEIIRLLNQYLGKIPRKASRVPNQFELTTEKPRKVKIESSDTLQAAIRIGRRLFNRQHQDYCGMFVLNTIFGGYFGSRLMDNIREDKGYTYNIFSAIDPMLYDGYFYIGTEVGNEFLSETLNEIYKELNLLRTTLVGPEELQMVRNYLLGNMLNHVDGPFNTSDMIKTMVLDGIGVGHFEKLVSTIKNITAEELQSLAQQYFKEEDLWEVVVGV